jgi:outer membrane protein OmpA-like peptidoglycan-associated protein
MKALTTRCGAAALLICGTMACSAERQPARTASETANPSKARAAQEAASEAASREDRQTTVQLSDEIRRECRFPESPSELPRFELDQSTLRADGKNVLDDVANCLKEGPLQHRTITIIGRADPRGTAEHNHELGANRAQATRNYLLQKGVQEQKLLVVSRGEDGAQGEGEAGWALDRRVDLVLGDGTQRTSINQNPSANVNASTRSGAGSPYADQSEGGPASGKVTGSAGPGTDSVQGK